jgi:dienelactone hydrolase
MLAVLAALTFLFISCKKDLEKNDVDALSQTKSSDATAADGQSETSPPTYRSVVTNVNSNCAGFWEAIPSLYSQTTKKYPLIVFLHGIGELGTTLSRMNCCGLPNHLYNKTFPPEFVINGARHSFIVIAPQFKTRATAAHVQSVIDFAKRRYRVDETRIYVTGLSLGGGSTWDWSAVYGQNAAAIVPVCGGTKPTTTLTQQIASKNLPIWGLYSTADAAVPAQWGRDFFAWIDKYNPTYAPKTKLTMWADASHNTTWARAYNPATKIDGYNIYQWMLLYKRGTSTTAPAPAPSPTPVPPTSGNSAPIARAGSDQIVPASWRWFPELNGNTSSDADGWIAKYAWTKISGPACTVTPIQAGRAKVTGWTAGTYVFRITVTDNKGATAYDDIKITISGTTSTYNMPPTARTMNNLSVPRSWNWFPELNGNFSKDSDGWITKYSWAKISGPACTITPVIAGRARVSGWSTGTYVFRVTVTDNKGATSSDDVTVAITNN